MDGVVVMGAEVYFDVLIARQHAIRGKTYYTYRVVKSWGVIEDHAIERAKSECDPNEEPVFGVMSAGDYPTPEEIVARCDE